MPRHNKTIPQQPYPPPRGHDTKRRFSTEREARAAADYQMNLKPELQLRTYKCLSCSGWHLTHQSK